MLHKIAREQERSGYDGSMQDGSGVHGLNMHSKNMSMTPGGGRHGSLLGFGNNGGRTG